MGINRGVNLNIKLFSLANKVFHMGFLLNRGTNIALFFTSDMYLTLT
jgi:hypothetical protein